VFVFVPNGVNMWEWHPATTGKDYELTPPLKNLADCRKRFTVFSGLQHKAIPGHGELAVWLTANANYTAGKGAVTKSTISIDQHIAEAVGRQTRWPSMVVGATGGRRTISFDRQGEPVLADQDLSAIFAELVGAHGREKLPRRASILDLVSSQAAALRRELGKSDERKLEEYLDSVRTVEKRVQADIAWQATARAEVIDKDRLRLQSDPYAPANYAEYIDTMFELIYLALRTDSTRVVSFATTESEGGGPIKNLPCGNWHNAGHNTGDAPPEQKPAERLRDSQRVRRLVDRPPGEIPRPAARDNRGRARHAAPHRSPLRQRNVVAGGPPERQLAAAARGRRGTAIRARPARRVQQPSAGERRRRQGATREQRLRQEPGVRLGPASHHRRTNGRASSRIRREPTHAG